MEEAEDHGYRACKRCRPECVSVAESIPTRTSASLVVHVGYARITLQKDFDPQLLREAVEALSERCRRFWVLSVSTWQRGLRICANRSTVW
ncbi:MAG: Ada metal-binding domain-containing protein [Bacillota bacterium]